MRLLTFIASLFLSFAVNANDMVVHTVGDVQSRVLAKMFFPDAPVIGSPGADGAFVWKKLEGNSTDIAIQVPLVAHYFALTNKKEDPTQNHELLATLAQITQALVARPELPVTTVKDIKKLQRTVSVGWMGHSCDALTKKVFAAHGVEYVYVPFKSIPEALNAFFGGHIDFICPAGASLRQATQNNAGKVIVDYNAYYGFQHTTFIYVNRDMPEQTKQKILQRVTRQLTAEDRATADSNGFVLSVHTGKAAKDIFDRERQAWQKVLN